MANMLDYLRWRGDLRFRERDFNQVDNLILATLAYTGMDGLLPPEGMSLAELARAYEAEGRDQSQWNCDPGPLLHAAADTVRFGQLWLSDYVNRVDPTLQLQFSAVCFHLPDGTVYVAYRGTDDSLTGWREDFNMSYLNGTPGQQAAVDYLERCAARTRAPLRLGGHSKGGNFAVYAGAFCGEMIRERLLRVYCNDGPGFNRHKANAPQLRQISARTENIIPESSLVGILLSGLEQKQVIHSDASGIQQHNPYSWQVLGAAFEAADQRSALSLITDQILRRWLESMDDGQRQRFVSALFDAVEASGATTLTELNANRRLALNAMLRAARELDRDVQREVLLALKELAVAGTDSIWGELKRSFDRWESELRGKQNEKGS